ncbi:MAG: TetR/AcrR family transcriptional regulator [Acidobacteriota bacterium]
MGAGVQEVNLPRRERQRLERRSRILVAALELFSDKGYCHVSMEEISKKAQFAIGTLYKFFRNKDDLYSALILEHAQSVDDEVKKAVEGCEHETDKLRRYVVAKGMAFCTRESMIRLYFAETHGASVNVMAGLDSEIGRRRGEFRRILASVFESGMKKGLFRRIGDPFHLAVAVESLTEGFLLLRLKSPESHTYPKVPDIILNILFEGLLDQ